MIITFDIIEKDIDLQVGLVRLDQAMLKKGLGRSPILKNKIIRVRSKTGRDWAMEAEIIGVSENQLHIKYIETGLMQWIDPIHTHDITIPSY